MIKSPLRYPGGKSRAVAFLAQFIPPFQEMREVFLGGGSFTFYCAQKRTSKTYAASDLNFELFCFWSQLQSHKNELITGVQAIFDAYKGTNETTTGGKALFDLLASRRENELTDLERAVDFYVLNRITYSGVVDSGGFSFPSFNERFTQSSIDRLSEAFQIIRHIQLFCEDYSFLINQEGTDVFLFLDPPYYAATKSKLYGKNGILHTKFDHQLLFEKLINCPHKWLMTYDNSEFIRDLYHKPGLFQKEWQLQYGMTSRNNASATRTNELLIANYDLDDIKSFNNTENVLSLF